MGRARSQNHATAEAFTTVLGSRRGANDIANVDRAKTFAQQGDLRDALDVLAQLPTPTPQRLELLGFIADSALTKYRLTSADLSSFLAPLPGDPGAKGAVVKARLPGRHADLQYQLRTTLAARLTRTPGSLSEAMLQGYAIDVQQREALVVLAHRTAESPTYAEPYWKNFAAQRSAAEFQEAAFVLIGHLIRDYPDETFPEQDVPDVTRRCSIWSHRLFDSETWQRIFTTALIDSSFPGSERLACEALAKQMKQHLDNPSAWPKN